MRTGTVIVTGGTGVTGAQLIKDLAQAGVPYLSASRNPKADTANAVKFDFADESTWSAPFDAATVPVAGVYLVLPYLLDAAERVSKFVDFAVARTRGAAQKLRFALLTEAASDPYAQNAMFVVAVHRHLHEQAALGALEYGAINATGFASNFSEEVHPFIHGIKDEGILYSGPGEGMVPWVTAEDIARTAFYLLVNEEPLNDAVVVLGPDVLSYADVAALISEASGKKIVHKELTKEAYVAWLIKLNVPDWVAQWLGEAEEGIGIDSARFFKDDYKRNGIKRVTGRDPIKFKDFVQKNKAVWQ